jgi:S1-C subfamily serine protease
MKKFFSKSRLTSYILLALIALIIGLAAGSTLEITPFSAASENPLTEENNPVVNVPGNSTNIFADIAETANEGVVLVTSEIEVEGQPNPFFNDPFFEYFFGDRMGMPDGPRTQEGFGSGFIVTEDGYIVTNEHVIHNATDIKVTINGIEEPVPAEVVWSDYYMDLAILNVDVDQKLTAIKMGDSDSIRPGDWAIAIGNPLGFEHTVTVGVISALERPITIPGEDGNRHYPNLIQTDAAINSGNSGGPLLNIKGEVIGINTAVSTQGQGIGFAIPVNEVKDIVADLKETGEIIRPWLGISYGEMDTQTKEQYKEYYGLEKLNGVIVYRVYADSPAYKAGLRPNDIITRINDQEIKELNDVQEIVESKNIGDSLKIEIIRDGYSRVLFAEVGKKPAQIK